MHSNWGQLERGERVSTNDENIRELIHKGYTVPYFIDESNSKIIVLGIFNRNIWN